MLYQLSHICLWVQNQVSLSEIQIGLSCIRNVAKTLGTVHLWSNLRSACFQASQCILAIIQNGASADHQADDPYLAWINLLLTKLFIALTPFP